MNPGKTTARGIGALALLLAAGGGGLADTGTSAQRAACTPDAFRLCRAEIPDVGRVTACLRRERASLSSACGGVFDALDRSVPATRSLSAPAAAPGGVGAWCTFGPGSPPGQDVWIAWCDEGARGR